MRSYTILISLIFFLTMTIPCLSQQNESWLSIKIHCDTCTNKNCDTLIVKKSYIRVPCSVKKDTVYSSEIETKPLIAGLYDPIVYFADFDYFICSETLIDSNENYTEYEIVQLHQQIYYRKIFLNKKIKLVTLYDENHNLIASDSVILCKKNKNKISFLTSHSKYEQKFIKTKFQYYLNGKLKKTEQEIETNSYKVKYISLFTIEGKLKKNQYFQLEPTDSEKNEFEWVLFNESTFDIINSELTIEEYKSSFTNSNSKIYKYSGENYFKTVEKNGCFIKTEINLKL